MKMLTGAAGVSLLLTLAACGAALQPEARLAPAPTPPITAQPVTAPPAPVRMDSSAFTFKGALTQGGYAIGQAPIGTVAIKLDDRPLLLDATGRFVIGFGRDAPRAAMVEATLANGTRIRAPLSISPRQYVVQSIPGLPGTVPANPEYERMRADERARINAARTQRNLATGWQQSWIWPVTGRISGVYGSQRILGGIPRAPHFGVDIAVPSGTSIVAPADGVVVLASPPQFSLEGNLLIIDHGMGLNTAYLHLSQITVRTGDRVQRGQRIGAVGTTGRSTGPHLHWSLNWLDQRLDPALLTGPMPGEGAANAR